MCSRQRLRESLSRIPYGASQSLGPVHEELGRGGGGSFNKATDYTARAGEEGDLGGRGTPVTKILGLDRRKEGGKNGRSCKYSRMQSPSGFSTTAGRTFRKEVEL